MKKFLTVIAFVAISLLAVPQVFAQTKQQEKELEEIAKRSINGVSAKDKARVIEILTDVFVKEGMSREQAKNFAEMAAGNMFTTDVAEMTPEQKRQFAEQEERLNYMEKPLNERIEDSLRAVGRNPGWPSAAAFKRYGFTLKQPKDLGDLVFSWVEGANNDGGPKLTILIEAKGGYSLKPEEMFFGETVLQKVEQMMASGAGTLNKDTSNDSYRYYERADPQRKNTKDHRYYISTVVQPHRSAGQLAGITITLTTSSQFIGSVQ